MALKNLKTTDFQASKLLKKELLRQQQVINLIPSENYASSAVLEAVGSIFANKYSEGYPKARYYPGNEVVDSVEMLAQARARKLFKLGPQWNVNVQALSGAPANLAVYSALLFENDKALGMRLSAGGHLSHGHKVSLSGKLFHFEQYGVTKHGHIDFEEVARLARQHKPKLIVAGHSAYPFKLDFKKFKAIAKQYGALLMVDMAHFAGLVAGGVHPSPFPYADIVTTTTHKTLRGPRGAIIFSKDKEISSAIRKAVFPGMQGGPHDNQTFAIAVALKEASSPKFKAYAAQIVKNAAVLAQELSGYGFKICGGGTENHLMLVDVTPLGISGKVAEDKLYQAGIVVNRNAIPFDTRPAYDPSGIRLGTPAATTRGFKKKEMRLIAAWMHAILMQKAQTQAVRKQVFGLTKKFPLFY